MCCPSAAKNPISWYRKGALIERIAIVKLIINYEVQEGSIQISQKRITAHSLTAEKKKEQTGLQVPSKNSLDTEDKCGLKSGEIRKHLRE